MIFLNENQVNTQQLKIFFFELVKTQFQTKIQIVRTDNGLEFGMPDYYASQGVIHQRSCVETPQQNGVVERKHKYLLNVARALRFQAKLPLHFWSDCILVAAYLINRIPISLLLGKSSYELLFSLKPTNNHHQIF